MDRMQLDFQCCGNTGPEDWYTIQWKANEFINDRDLLRYDDAAHLSPLSTLCSQTQSVQTSLSSTQRLDYDSAI